MTRDAAAAARVADALRQANLHATVGRTVYAHVVTVRGTPDGRTAKLIRQIAHMAAAPAAVTYQAPCRGYLTITCEGR